MCLITGGMGGKKINAIFTKPALIALKYRAFLPKL